jgi:hypothetical protein
VIRSCALREKFFKSAKFFATAPREQGLELKMQTIIRFTRHPADEARIVALKEAFGEDIDIVDRDIPFGDDPVTVVREVIAQFGDVPAIEVVAPIPVLAKLSGAKRELGNILILRAEFRKGSDGRALVASKDAAGRDVFSLSHYEVIERVEVVTRVLGKKGRVPIPLGFESDLRDINGG